VKEDKQIKILRRPQVEEMTGLSRSTLYLRMKSGKFPRPVNLGGRAVGWLSSTVENWILEQCEQEEV
jgi:prophage regulatory protein